MPKKQKGPFLGRIGALVKEADQLQTRSKQALLQAQALHEKLKK